RDPRGRRARAVQTQEGYAPMGLPEDLPVVRHRARPQGGRGLLALPEQARVPVAEHRVAVQLRLARRAGHRGPRLQDRDRADRPGAGSRPRRRVLAHRRRPDAAAGVRRQVDLEPPLLDRGGEGPADLAAPHGAEHPARRHPRRAGPGERVRVDRRAARGVRTGRRRRGGDRARDRPQRPRVVRRHVQPEADREAARGRRSDEGRDAEEAEGQAAARRQDDRPYGRPRGPVARRGGGRGGGRRRPRGLERVEEDGFRRRGREPGHEGRAGRGARRRDDRRPGVRQAPGPQDLAPERVLEHLWHDARVPDEGDAMRAVVIDGNAIAEQLRQSIADELQVLRLSEVRPGLATVLIGESFDAQAYEKHVKRLAESLDYRYVCERLPEDIELADVIATLGKLNADPRITGILVLHPLPPHIPEAEMNSAVDPLKDIEAVHPLNTGLLAQGRPRFLPSTPASCFYLLDQYADAHGGGHESFYSGR